MSVLPKLQLSRKQLKTVCHDDPEAIRLMERLFAVGARFEPEVWTDIDFPIIIRNVAAGTPVLGTINGNLTMPQWAVNDAIMCESQEFIHGWKEGSEVSWHIHLTLAVATSADRYVRFTIEFGYCTIGGQWVFPPLVTTPDLLLPNGTPAQTMLVFNLASFIPGPSFKIATHAVARLKRISSVGSAPSTNPFISMLQLHVLSDTLGSRTVSAK